MIKIIDKIIEKLPVNNSSSDTNVDIDNIEIDEEIDDKKDEINNEIDDANDNELVMLTTTLNEKSITSFDF